MFRVRRPGGWAAAVIARHVREVVITKPGRRACFLNHPLL